MSPITATADQEFTITLESNRTTGYVWQIAQPPDERIAKLVRNSFTAPTSGLTGAPGQETWTFLAVAPGQTSVTLRYVRPFEPNQPPARTVAASIIVQPGGRDVRLPVTGRGGSAALITVGVAGVLGALGLWSAVMMRRRSGAGRSSG